MGINRITNGFMSKQATYFLNGNLGLLSTLQQRLASGKNINQPSDDPVGLTRILDLTNTLSTDTRYNKNVDDALAEVNVADSVIGNMTELVQRAKELAVQGANFSNSQDGLNALALEINQILNQMVQLGNTSIGGKYIFAGMRVDQPPFVRDPVTFDVTYSGTPAAEDFSRPVEIAKGVELDININGESLLGRVQVTTPFPVPPVFGANTSPGIFRTLTELMLDMGNNANPGNKDEIRLRLDEIDADLNSMLAERSRIGSITNRLDLTKSRIQERGTILTQQFADIQNIDLPKLSADINYQENVFQTSLGVMGRVLQSSLLDYLR